VRLGIGLLCILAFAMELALLGCEQDVVKQFQANQSALKQNEGLATDQFTASITFCKRVGKKTGRYIGRGHDFTMAEKSYVHGMVDFTNVPCDRTQSIHLVWIKPDGRELYRRYAEVLVTQTSDGYFTLTKWLDAEDLGYLKEVSHETDEARFTLSSRLNTSKVKEREVGRYKLRVYWNRELLLEDSFQLTES